jgi:glycosyltransferase involved in cell wall biosynthesis
LIAHIRMKKIVHLSTAHSATDIRIFLKECRSLARGGYDVTLIAKAGADEVRDGVQILHIPLAKSGRLTRYVMTSWHVLKKAWACKADLYHFHDPELIPAGVALRLSGARVVYDVHEDVPKQILAKDWLPGYLRRPVAGAMRALEWTTTRLCFSGVITATPAIATMFSRKACPVQNFPLPEELGPAVDSQAATNRPPHIAYVGGITRIRGIIETVDALAHVKTPGAKLKLVGECNERETDHRAKSRPGWEKVDAHGWQSRKDAAAIMAACRAGLVVFHPVPNHIEAQPNKMFEYMAAGLPVIASDFPLWRSIIDGAQCGLLVDPMDPEAIATAIDWVLTHPDEADAMGRRGRDAVKAQYNWASEERKLLDFYGRILA